MGFLAVSETEVFWILTDVLNSQNPSSALKTRCCWFAKAIEMAMLSDPVLDIFKMSK